MLTDDHQQMYVRGASALLKSARRHGMYYFDEFIVLLLSGREYDSDVVDKLIMVGWQIRYVDPIIPPMPSSFPRFKDQFTKLHAWNMTEYSQLIYMDLDVVFVDSLSSELFTTNSSCRIWAGRDFRAGKFVKTFNMGVFGIIPNATEYIRLLSLLNANSIHYEVIMSEQGWLNVVYESVWCELQFRHNANLAVYYASEHGTSLQGFWNAQRVEIVHFTMSKPWECQVHYFKVCQLWERESMAISSPLTVVREFFNHSERSSIPTVLYTQHMNNTLQTHVEGAHVQHLHITDQCENTVVKKLLIAHTATIRAVLANVYHSSRFLCIPLSVKATPVNVSSLMLLKHSGKMQVVNTCDEILGGVDAWLSWGARFLRRGRIDCRRNITSAAEYLTHLATVYPDLLDIQCEKS
eukprot:CAMPEP_0202860986 /NCGR_PEP_ID=MMETSP1391-20130828/2531_1 /ASSEMBLY_ACC=CAM_ASM_000867 /TAXON_ID=1034604 /ORGANISM="Chlamydomonas leiostraca, Strain SAG 11-49" /LENGTH=407 /DNA_ID=CAMNT_0049540285 /DNA_START=446 /DNA_END=1669 /DNA_ORIENTATION=-